VPLGILICEEKKPEAENLRPPLTLRIWLTNGMLMPVCKYCEVVVCTVYASACVLGWICLQYTLHVGMPLQFRSLNKI
jgi:hypothetical protein